MSLFAARNLSLLLMLASFPLVSVGATGNRPLVWWLGLASLTLGALIPPVMRFLPRERVQEHKRATDLGESSRVC